MGQPGTIESHTEMASNERPHLNVANHPIPETASSPLFLDSVLAFSQQRWGLKHERLRFTRDGKNIPAVETVLFTDGKGRITAPRLSPYIPVQFESTDTQMKARIDRQWLDVGGSLADHMREVGLASIVVLPPEVTDVRPWQWAGFNVRPRYLIHVQLPLDVSEVDSSARKKAAKAERDGYRVELTAQVDDVMACLKSTQSRQDFRLDLDEADLVAGLAMMGSETFRTYVCYAPDGEPAATRILLHHPGTRAIDWAGGVSSNHLNSGANQLLIRHMLEDLHAAGATAFDFSDASLPSVAAMKTGWAGELVTVYAVDGGRIRALMRDGRDYLRSRRRH